MGLPKLLFFVIGCLLVELTYPSNDYLEQWYSTLSDSRHECPVTSILTSANSDAPEIYTVAKDCSEPDARWDYNFISKIKPKKGGVFEGKGRISVPLKVKRDYRPEHNNYKFGFKHNKCLKFFQEGISRIQGNFVQDRIEGHVKIDFLEGGYLLGQARQSKLVGVVRHFDDLNKLQNVTIYGKNSEIELSVHKNSYGYFEFATPKSRAENRIHLSRDFNQIYSCEVEGEFLFRNCYESTDINSEIQKCNIILDDKTVKPSDPAILFSWNLQTKETFHNNANPYADESASWLTENVRGLLTKWIKLMDNVDSDPFWKEYDVNYPRLNPKRPEIVLSVPEFKNRLIKTSVNFTSGSSSNANEPVLEGSWNNGEITAKVPEDLLSNGIWSSLLKIHYANEESSGMSFHVDEPFVGTIGRLKQGKLHGIVRRFGKIITNPAHLCGNRLFSGISYIGRHEDGVPVGPQWRVVIGSGYIYGNVDEKGEFTGDDIAYIYPDFQTVMFGEFKNGIMIKARECQVEAVKFSRGIPELKFTEPLGPYFHHKVPTHDTYGDQPLLTDPVDTKYMYIRQSDVDHEVADEGAFAKIDIPKDTVITLYSGFNLNPIELALYNNRSTEELLANNISNADPAWSVPTKYHGSVKECGFTITIPPSDGPLDKYRATLGHKLNHSFKPNCEYGGILDSPRFGLVRAFYTNRDIKKDEELFIAYGYPVETGPLWYRELYNKSVARGEMDALTGLTSFLKNKEKQPSN